MWFQLCICQVKRGKRISKQPNEGNDEGSQAPKKKKKYTKSTKSKVNGIECKLCIKCNVYIKCKLCYITGDAHFQSTSEYSSKCGNSRKCSPINISEYSSSVLMLCFCKVQLECNEYTLVLLCFFFFNVVGKWSASMLWYCSIFCKLRWNVMNMVCFNVSLLCINALVLLCFL